MKNQILGKCVIILCLAMILFSSCKKDFEKIISSPINDTISLKTDSIVVDQFIKYTILQGQHYCDKSVYAATKYQQLSFKVKFDSSAIYQNVQPINQEDINKLFGFSDNNAFHQVYSARFGWRWSNNALRLFAYVYNNGVRINKELGTVVIGAEINCAIKVTSSNYIFILNGTETLMPRESTTVTADGYKLYPYFGGDETAPHTISIWINELK